VNLVGWADVSHVDPDPSMNGSDVLLMFLLRGKSSEVYGQKSLIAVTRNHEVDYRNMSTEELKARLAKGLALSNV
jgi:hypothetical protein